MSESENFNASATEKILKQMQLLQDVAESIRNERDKKSIHCLCMLSESMARLMTSLPDELR